jgi:membrane associated rhomboid family serine protease
MNGRAFRYVRVIGGLQMYTAFGMIMGAMFGLALMALYGVGISLGFAGALIGCALGALTEELMPKRRSQPTA